MKKCGNYAFTCKELLSISLLLQLLNKPQIGYYLYKHIDSILPIKNIKIPVLYRALRILEENGYAVSRWHHSNNTPAKRIYYITNKGVNYLQSWLNNAKQHISTIDKLIADVEIKLHQIGE